MMSALCMQMMTQRAMLRQKRAYRPSSLRENKNRALSGSSRDRCHDSKGRHTCSGSPAFVASSPTLDNRFAVNLTLVQEM